MIHYMHLNDVFVQQKVCLYHFFCDACFLVFVNTEDTNCFFSPYPMYASARTLELPNRRCNSRMQFQQSRSGTYTTVITLHSLNPPVHHHDTDIAFRERCFIEHSLFDNCQAPKRDALTLLSCKAHSLALP
jgi:hypothetical protein